MSNKHNSHDNKKKQLLLEELAVELMRGNKDPRLKKQYLNLRDSLSPTSIQEIIPQDKKTQNTTINKHITCPQCKKKFLDLSTLDLHISTKHAKFWVDYSKEEDVEKRISSKNLIRCIKCGLFVKNIDDHLEKCNQSRNEKNTDQEIKNLNISTKKDILDHDKLIQNNNEIVNKSSISIETDDIREWDKAIDLDIIKSDKKLEENFMEILIKIF